MFTWCHPHRIPSGDEALGFRAHRACRSTRDRPSATALCAAIGLVQVRVAHHVTGCANVSRITGPRCCGHRATGRAHCTHASATRPRCSRAPPFRQVPHRMPPPSNAALHRVEREADRSAVLPMWPGPSGRRPRPNPTTRTRRCTNPSARSRWHEQRRSVVQR